MNERHQMHPLTPNQSEFAAQNHDLVFQFLHKHGLSEEEFYSEVILRYLNAVQRYDEYPELRRYSFKTIAFSAMDSAVGHYREKQRRRQTRERSLQQLTSSGLMMEEIVGQTDPGFLEVEQREERQRISAQISRREKNIIHLKFQGFTHKEVGKRFGCSSSSIDNQLYNMRRRLKSGAAA